MRVVQELLSKDDTDFRRVFPFVFGLIKILLRKFNFLISESNSTLESLRNPFAEEVEEIDGPVRRQPNKANKRDGAYQVPQGGLNKKKNFIDLSNVKYHGIDQGYLDKIEEALKLDVLAHQKK